MAVTSLWPIKYRLDKVINYVRNPEKITEEYYSENAAMHVIDGVLEYAADDTKTERREYVTCLNCGEQTAARDFVDTKKLWRKDDGRLCYHGYQSFKPGEVNAETAHAIGVELAKQLWGDRFQVVVATHCNTGVYHNHLVINSVSFRDGYKFYNSKADYRQMREVSDRLCREHGLSVIEEAKGKGKNHALYAAEQNGKPTHAKMIRSDIDRAIAASLTRQEFFWVMEQMGYSITTHGKSGAPLKHPKLTPPDAGKNYRFDTLGEEYTLERILERIYGNVHRTPAFEEPKPTLGIVIQKRSYKMTRKPVHKLTGLRALYFKYCVLLGIVKNHPERIQRPSYLLREDVLKLDRYIAKATLLINNKIETVADLQAYREGLQESVAQLTAERQELRNALKRAERTEDEPAKRNCTAQIKQISVAIQKVRKGVRLCEEIEVRSTQVSEKLRQTKEKPDMEAAWHQINPSEDRTCL
jgi:Relaxase/Mobilisation nuclease domain.